MASILFICTANQCRSPVAELLFRHHIGQASCAPADEAWRVESAGTWAQPNCPAHRTMRMLAVERGLDLSQHIARDISEIADLESFDLIVTMEAGQKESIQIEFPRVRSRVALLSELAAGIAYDVPDPIGRTEERFRASFQEIERLIVNAIPTVCERLALRHAI